MNPLMSSAIAEALHVLSAVTWVGGMLFVMLCLRPGLKDLDPPVRLPFFSGVLKRFFLIVWLAVILILLSGYWLLFKLFGGFAQAPVHVHLMHVAGLLMSVLFFWLFFSLFLPLRKAVKNSEWQTAAPLVDRLRLVVTVNLLLGVAVVIVATTGRYLS